MKVVVVYESMFGNTEELAEQVSIGVVDAGAEVRTVEVGQATGVDLQDLDLLVVAAPTHALSLSRPESRAEAVAKGASPARARTGVREWLAEIATTAPEASRLPLAAVLDTRVEKARHWPGSAAGRAARGLRKAGFTVVGRASFFVEGLPGSLVEGEGEHARAWARDLVGQVQQECARS